MGIPIPSIKPSHAVSTVRGSAADCSQERDLGLRPTILRGDQVRPRVVFRCLKKKDENASKYIVPLINNGVLGVRSLSGDVARKVDLVANLENACLRTNGLNDTRSVVTENARGRDSTIVAATDLAVSWVQGDSVNLHEKVARALCLGLRNIKLLKSIETTSLRNTPCLDSVQHYSTAEAKKGQREI
jgi:hypothetical protein